MPGKNCPYTFDKIYTPKDIETLRKMIFHPGAKRVLVALGDVVNDVTITCCNQMTTVGDLSTPCYSESREVCDRGQS